MNTTPCGEKSSKLLNWQVVLVGADSRKLSSLQGQPYEHHGSGNSTEGKGP